VRHAATSFFFVGDVGVLVGLFSFFRGSDSFFSGRMNLTTIDWSPALFFFSFADGEFLLPGKEVLPFFGNHGRF